MPTVRIADDLFQKVEIIIRAKNTTISEYISRLVRPQVEAEWYAHQDVYEEVMEAIRAEKKATEKLLRTIQQSEDEGGGGGETGKGSPGKGKRRPSK